MTKTMALQHLLRALNNADDAGLIKRPLYVVQIVADAQRAADEATDADAKVSA